ncbi:MAG: YkoF family thiamine/hydroxymethylpyrimidine-binding protein [Pseudomonadota bacterium]
MNISVEISYYPLQDEYVQSILEFVDRLKSYTELQIKSTGISTQVFGKYSDVMRVLTLEIEKSFTIPNSVFVLKIINSDLQIHPNSYE